MLSKLVPLVILFIVLAVAAFVGYAIYTIATDIADKTSKKMEKKNVSFGKEGMKIGVKEVKNENYVDQTQRQVIRPRKRRIRSGMVHKREECFVTIMSLADF